MTRRTRLLASLVACLLVTACASAPPLQSAPPDLFQDALFKPPSQSVQPQQIFALSDEMKRYVSTDIAGQLRAKGLQKGLLEALYRKTQLKLEYDSERTRNATEAFDARIGNCLSLVIMTAAFAKHLGLKIQYQTVYVDETWTRTRDTYFASGHVNLTLGTRWAHAPGYQDTGESWTIDFLPPEDIRGQRTRAIPEETIVAMYMNNRAAESMAAGRLDDAYAFARASIESAPGFTSAYNTLGIVYLRHGNLAQAERVLAHALQREPASTVLLHNMARVLDQQGRTAESREFALRLARLEPEPPFHFFDLGQAALLAGDARAASTWFAKEVARAPYHPEFHFWLAIAQFRLGDVEAARKHLTIAMQNSTTRSDQRLYAAKLDKLRSGGLH